ncbi:bacterioferritin [Allohahella sp. A8]|uniref:bacterioferritin n=1 Tax=Allohahella sp. A8 TaxID=3141461 RepID=UPI000C09E924|nr:bacterioferritin [Hahellaceae bacterium]|tara:strand:+ start:41050 stop:41523 length:474 start_codon:yes stop_codon:yes gene_type:complete
MQGDPKLIQSLNGILTYELTSINQYFLHARMFRHLGLEALNGKSYSKSIEDMKQADRLIERILFLQGLPNLQKLGKLSIGEHPEEMLRADLGFAVAQLPLLRDGISLCEVQRDFVSRDLLEGILHYEEEHIEWIETQLSLIGSIGVQRYLQSQISSD